MARAKAKKAVKKAAKKTRTTAPAAKPGKASAAKTKPAAKKAAKVKASAKKAPAKKVAVKKAAAKKAAPKKVSAKKASPKQAAAKKAAAKKPAARKAAAKSPSGKASVKKPAARKTSTAAAKKKAPAKKPTAVKARKAATPKKASGKAGTRKQVAPKAVTKAAAATPKKKTSTVPRGEKKKPGLEEVKAAAARTKKKVSKRGRRRQRVTPTSTPLANWIPKDGLRPSSFLPAPPRAQSAFTVAAAPASSDRLVREEDLAPPAPIRTIPVLVHVVQESGRIQVRTTPASVEVAPGDAVEWDFRYFGGADVLVTQVAIEIGRPSPFGKTAYKSAKPGSARPHRQVSDIVKDKALDSTTDYTIHCTNAFKTELAQGSASIVVKEAEPTDAAH